MIRTRRRPIHQSLRSRLMVRGLEERVTPTVFTVLNNADSGAGSLRQAILDANAIPGADTVNFDPGYFATQRVITLSSQISSGGDLVIEGPGKSLLTVKGDNTFGLIDFYVQEHVSVSGISFIDGKGAVPSIANAGALKFRNYDPGSQKAMVDNCDFNNNYSISGGGAISGDHVNLIISDCSFVQNQSERDGGAIEGGSSITITRCSFAKNSGEFGGAISSSDTAEISLSQFSGNSATKAGGAIFGDSDQSQVIVDKCTFENNQSNERGGGGIYAGFGCSLVVRRSEFFNNVANCADEFYSKQGGGAIFCFGGTFEYPAGAFDRFCGLLLEDSLVAGNIAKSTNPNVEVSGGGVLFVGPPNSLGVRIVNSTIENNSLSERGHYGAGVALSDTGDVTIDNSTIANNSFSSNATQYPNVGGGIARFGTSGTTILRSTIVAGNTTNGGVGPDINGSGPISVAASNSLIGVSDSGSFSLTTSIANQLGTLAAPLDPQFLPLGKYGGPTQTLGLKSTSPAIDTGSNPNTLFYDQRGDGFSRVAGAGPDIGAFERISEFFVTNIDNAGSGSLRAALENSSVNPDAETISFSSSLFTTPQTITLTKTSSIDGSHIAYLGITGSVTINGPASGLTLQGGKLARIFHIDMTNAKSPVVMTNLRYIDGRALDGDGGGAILNKDAALSLTNCQFSFNQSNNQGDGGAVELLTSDASLTATDCRFEANISGLRGGALAAHGGSSVDLYYSHFIANSSDNVGGAIGVFNSRLNADSCYVGNNTTVFNGGGIGVLGDNPFESGDAASTITLTNCTIAQNVAKASYGGGLFLLFNGNSVLQNSTVTQNSALVAGGGIAGFTGGGCLVISSIVAGNVGPCRDIIGGNVVAQYSLIGNTTDTTTINSIPFNSVPAFGSNNFIENVDPLLSAPFGQGRGDTIYALKPNSPARDKGTYPPGQFLAYDQRGPGFSRYNYPQVDMGSFEVTPPSAGAFAPAITAAGNTPVLITVSFFEESGIDVTTLDNSDITVSGPSFPLPVAATFVSYASNGPGSYAATYSVTAPPAGWEFAGNGYYTVTLQPNQIYDFDANGQTGFQNPAPGGNIGQFRVAIGTTFVVDTIADKMDPSDGKMSLREAINAASANSQATDTITFDPVVFTGNQTITLEKSLGGLSSFDPLFVMGPVDGVTILKTGTPAQFDLPLFRLFTGDQTGGSSSTPSGFSRVNFVGGGGFAGAVNISGGQVSLTDCSITGSGVGGGLTINRANITLTRCTIANNIGSGIKADSSIVLIDSCTISGNTTTDDGGGIFATGYFDTHLITVRNSTISGNQAANGGAIAIRGLSLILDNSTLTDCVATGAAHAISQVAYGAFKTIQARSTIFSGPSSEMFQFGAATFTANNCLFRFTPDEPLEPSSGNNLIGVDPLLGPLANNGGATKTHAIIAGSPALDKGANPLVLTTDQRGSGFDRVSGTAADIGAYEYQVPPPPGTMSASFIGDATIGYRLVILDEALDRNNGITFTYDGTNLIITDAKEAFTGLAKTPDGKSLGTLSNGNQTISIPFASLTNFDAVDFLTAGGNDTLTVDWTTGLFPCDMTFAGGKGNDYLVIKGGEFLSIKNNFTLPVDGNSGGIAFFPPGGPNVELIYQDLEPIDLIVNSVGTLEFDLPPTMSNAFLEDDGITGNGISQIRSMNNTFEFTTFIAPTNSLIVKRGKVDDTLTLAALPDFNQNLSIGTAAEPFENVSITGSTSFATDKSVVIFAKTIVLGAAITASGSGAVSLNATESLVISGNIAANGGTVIASPLVQILGPLNSNNGDIVIRGDDIRLDPAATINAGTGTVTIQTYTPGVALELGVVGDVSGGPARLSLAELSQVTAASLVLGSTQGGNITLFDNLVRSAPTNVTLLANGNINISIGHINTAGGSLKLTANGSVKPTLAGIDVVASKVTCGAGTDLNLNIDGPIVDAQYTRLTVNGSVDLADIDLSLSGAYVPAVNDAFFLVNATSILNTFTGFADGDTLTFNGEVMAIHYTPTVVTLTRVLPPCVAATMVNDGAAQRSKITSLRVDFDKFVSFVGDPGASFELRRNTDNAIVNITAAVVNSASTQVTLTFSGNSTEFGSLADGRYTLTVLASKITSAGLNLDGDCNGVAGDDYSFLLHRLFGDADGNGSVTASDFNAFRLAYGSTGPSIFDFDGDNQVSASDFNDFRTRYGVTLVP